MNILKGNVEYINLLIEAGANVNAQNKIGQIPLNFSVVNDDIKTSKVIIYHTLKENPLADSPSFIKKNISLLRYWDDCK